MAYKLGTNVGQEAFADVNHLTGGGSATASASKGWPKWLGGKGRKNKPRGLYKCSKKKCKTRRKEGIF